MCFGMGCKYEQKLGPDAGECTAVWRWGKFPTDGKCRELDFPVEIEEDTDEHEPDLPDTDPHSAVNAPDDSLADGELLTEEDRELLAKLTFFVA